ncbi:MULTISPECIES: AraC family transcriptional regulator [unclassified Fusibacter]|uniref:AraC family transcriptional regulator n=1 Tax=unclassified Fusibacter TaxID=2624464 RepID=UPI00101291B1|nr:MULTISPECIES: AraC family transcriptional regulator [unclassified Fusibacter]MCK8060141.1 AraC family transcriptional regulator [Fusibacter sp. A2]NPE22283.1 AraC family transcriptional regulator [Fusibacter sp. A1]RXV61056.1 AraC family transcriptional regulator [Fusibacter sp. A1]
MYYIGALDNIFSYIEENLNQPFTLEDLTSVSGFSRCHFSRLFHSFTGHTLVDYVRGRRLSEAAVRLKDSNERIIDIALEYQFSSQESFTRSFSNYFGVSPAKFRKGDYSKYLLSPIDARQLVVVQGGIEVKPIVKEIGPLKVAGLLYEGTNQNYEIPELWGVFNQRVTEIQNQTKVGQYYGMCEPLIENLEDIDLDAVNDIRYLACVEVSDGEHLPKGMTYWEIPHTKYAVFTHIGDPALMGETYKSIYSKWLPESGYEVVHAHDFELYGKEFKPGEATSKMYIYVPIK